MQSQSSYVDPFLTPRPPGFPFFLHEGGGLVVAFPSLSEPHSCGPQEIANWLLEEKATQMWSLALAVPS